MIGKGTMYVIVPESDPGDEYLAGYDGNAFTTKSEVVRGIRALQRIADPQDDLIKWIAIEVPIDLDRLIHAGYIREEIQR